MISKTDYLHTRRNHTVFFLVNLNLPIRFIITGASTNRKWSKTDSRTSSGSLAYFRTQFIINGLRDAYISGKHHYGGIGKQNTFGVVSLAITQRFTRASFRP